MAIQQLNTDSAAQDQENMTISKKKEWQMMRAQQLHMSPGTVFMTYKPGEKEVSFQTLLPKAAGGKLIRTFSSINDKETGGRLYRIDGLACTAEAITEVGELSVPATSKKTGWDDTSINGPENIRSFEEWLKELSDEESAAKVRERFPKAFEPTPEPAPQPKATRRWPWQR